MLKNLRDRNRQSSNARITATHSRVGRDDLSIVHARAKWSNDSAHRWRPLNNSRIAKLRARAAIRSSAWFDMFLLPKSDLIPE